MENIKIAVKLGIIVAVACVGVIGSVLIGLLELREVMIEDRRIKTQHVVETAKSMTDDLATRAAKGEITPEEAKATAINALRAMRYGDDDYMWINDMKAVIVMHPFRPDLEGQDLSDMADANGVRLFSEFVAVVAKDGAGFVNYVWPKPGFDAPVAKISYVMGVPAWGWVIGSGIYIDDVNTAFRAQALFMGGRRF